MLQLDIEGTELSKKMNYREDLFKTFPNLQSVDGVIREGANFNVDSSLSGSDFDLDIGSESGDDY